MSEALDKMRRSSRHALRVAELREVESDPEATNDERKEARKSIDIRIKGGQAVADRIIKDREELKRRYQ